MSVNIEAAKKKRAARDKKEAEELEKIEAATRAALGISTHKDAQPETEDQPTRHGASVAPEPKREPAKKQKWTRKSVAIDDEIVRHMEGVAKRERKLFSHLAREFFIEGLKTRGIEL